MTVRVKVCCSKIAICWSCWQLFTQMMTLLCFARLHRLTPPKIYTILHHYASCKHLCVFLSLAFKTNTHTNQIRIMTTRGDGAHMFMSTGAAISTGKESFL